MLKNLNHGLKRILSALTDFFISLNIYSFFFAAGLFENYEKSIGYAWLLIIFNYVAFRATFNLILGTSLSQYIFGLRGEGGFLWKRLGGLIRSIYEIPSILFFPIAESPILFGNRTLKEYLSQTTIVPKNTKISLFGIFIFLPFTFFLAILSPFYEIFFVQNPIYSTKISNLTQKELKPERVYEVPSAGLKTISDLMKDRFVIIPSFKIIKWGRENEYRPQYIVYDKVLKRNLSFYFESGPEILSWIGIGKFLNPLFGVSYPELNSLKDNIFLSQQQSEDLESFLENSLRFNSLKPTDYLIYNGIFIRGPLSLKNEILKKYPAEKIEKIKLGGKTFLCFKETKNGKVFETFIPLFLRKGFVLRLSHSLDGEFRNDFLSTFFYFSKWEKPKVKGNFYLNKGMQDYKKFAAESLLTFAKEALALKDPLYQNSVLDGLDRFIFVSQLKGGIEFDIHSLNQLKLQKRALLEKNFSLKGN